MIQDVDVTMAASDARFCIHIGLSKTATTSLQNRFFPGHPEIEYLGKYNPGALHVRPKFYNDAATKIFEHIQRRPIDVEEAGALRRLLNEKILPHLDLDKLLVISSEGISSGLMASRMRRANNFKSIFGDCKILIVLREPLDLMESLYFQKLKESVLRKRGLWSRDNIYFSIEEWFGRFWKNELAGPLWHLDYYHTIKAYAEIFGDENVGVFLYEQLKENPSGFLRGICSFAGISADASVDILGSRQHNVRWNKEHLNRLREIQSSFIHSLIFRFYSRDGRKSALGLVDTENLTNSKKAEAEIPDCWKTRICEYVSPGNRILRDRWNLPLDKYNYPL